MSVGQGRAYEGVQRAEWPVDFYWKPDLTDGRFQRELGFPTLPGLLDRAVAPFAVAGLPVGWVSCFGNHEGLPFGVSLPTEQYRSVVTGARKPFALPDGLSPIGNVEDLYRHPERYLEGPARGVAPDPSRRLIGRRDFVAAHLAAPGKPAGHGFGAHNLEEATAYNALDVGGIRLVLLDTANLDGAADGSIGVRQLAWLEEQLVAVHSRYRAADGSFVTTSNTDRLVVLASHHGLVSMRDRGPVEGGLEPDHPRVGAQELRALLHRFSNVVLWLNGHRHVSEVAVHLSPDRRSAFAEVSTCSVSDWPSQSRLVEIVANADGTLSLLTEMLDHGAAAEPSSAAEGSEYFASLHRELAANVPGGGFGSGLEGRDKDRNVEVLLPAPFGAWSGV
jgi:metallophosphoesterase (TIGR03767 family)